jgi:ABC-type Fe3+-hydroxamate transport system, periplasmic component
MRSFAVSLVLSLGLVATVPDCEAQLRAAPGFSIEERGAYKLVSVKSPWPGAKKGFTYALYKRGTPRPAGLSCDGYFETPVRRVVSLSTTYLPQIVALGETDSIIGVDQTASVYSPEVRSRIAAGKISEVSRDWNPDVERLIALAPDAIFSFGVGNEWDSHPKLTEAGLPVIIGGDWNEGDPLARAEWLRFVAAFYGKEALADAFLKKVEAEYLRLGALAGSSAERPAVLVNSPFQGSWSVSGGKSYMARLIADAGGAYLWSDDASSGGLTLSVEAAYARALKAKIWLNPGQGLKSLAGLAALDPRFASLPVASSGEVWSNDLRTSAGGGNDYFESATLHPELVLADLIKIFHPQLLGDRPFSYYRHIPR